MSRRYRVFNVENRKGLESHGTLFAALSAAGVCNAHEVSNSRAGCLYAVLDAQTGEIFKVEVSRTNAYDHMIAPPAYASAPYEVKGT